MHEVPYLQHLGEGNTSRKLTFSWTGFVFRLITLAAASLEKNEKPILTTNKTDTLDLFPGPNWRGQFLILPTNRWLSWRLELQVLSHMYTPRGFLNVPLHSTVHILGSHTLTELQYIHKGACRIAPPEFLIPGVPLWPHDFLFLWGVRTLLQISFPVSWHKGMVGSRRLFCPLEFKGHKYY